MDAAIMFGLLAAAAVLVGWRRATGRATDAMAYWDLVAALTTPPDMTQWLSVAHDHGRVDLDAATLNNRRDTFLRSALDQLRRHQLNAQAPTWATDVVHGHSDLHTT